MPFLRPGEAKVLFVDDLVVPANSAQDSMNCAAIVVAPEERGAPSKTATFDDTIRMDFPQWLSPFVGRPQGERGRAAPLRVPPCSAPSTPGSAPRGLAALGIWSCNNCATAERRVTTCSNAGRCPT